MKIQMFLVVLQGCQFIVEFDSTETGDLLADEAESLDCSAYSYNGVIHDCTSLDRCDLSQENIPSRVACCDCDPDFCNPVTEEECPTDTGSEP